MYGWEEWSANLSNDEENVIRAFPRLRKIKMYNCLKLNTISLPKIPSLEKLTISWCSNVVLGSMASLGSVKKMKLRGIRGLTQLDEEIILFLKAVEDLRVEYCDELRYLWQEKVACQVLVKINVLKVQHCKQLVSLEDEESLLPHNLGSLELFCCDNLEKMPNWQNNIMSLRQLHITRCQKLKNMPSTAADLQPNIEKQGAMAMAESSKHGEDFSNLESVLINNCPCLTSFPTGKKLPTTLRHLVVLDCKNLEEPHEVGNMSSLESLRFWNWSNLKSLLEEGFAHLTRLDIRCCEGVESIPERSLSPTLITLEIESCINLKYFLCCDEIQRLTSLRELGIIGCENLESFPSSGSWPPNLISLKIGKVKQPITEWGLATLPSSLCTLILYGDSELVSFSEVGQLPIMSLTHLKIRAFEKLESLSKGLENFSSLEQLDIGDCPKLRSLPASTLLHKLSTLSISSCPLLEKRCQEKKGDYWPSISRIPPSGFRYYVMCGEGFFLVEVYTIRTFSF